MIAWLRQFKRILSTSQINLVSTDLEPDDMVTLHCLMQVMKRKSNYINNIVFLIVSIPLTIMLNLQIDSLLIALTAIFLIIFLAYITRMYMILIVGQGSSNIKMRRAYKYLSELSGYGIKTYIFESNTSEDYFEDDGKDCLDEKWLSYWRKNGQPDIPANKSKLLKLLKSIDRQNRFFKFFGFSMNMNFFVIKPLCEIVLNPEIRLYVQDYQCYLYEGWNIASSIPKEINNRNQAIINIINFFRNFKKAPVILSNCHILEKNNYPKTVNTTNIDSARFIDNIKKSKHAMMKYFIKHTWLWNRNMLRWIPKLVVQFLEKNKQTDNQSQIRLQHVIKEFDKIYLLDNPTDDQIKDSQRIFEQIPGVIIKNIDVYRSIMSCPKMQFTFADIHTFVAHMFPELYIYESKNFGISENNLLGCNNNINDTFFAMRAINLADVNCLTTNDEKWKNLLLCVQQFVK